MKLKLSVTRPAGITAASGRDLQNPWPGEIFACTRFWSGPGNVKFQVLAIDLPGFGKIPRVAMISLFRRRTLGDSSLRRSTPFGVKSVHASGSTSNALANPCPSLTVTIRQSLLWRWGPRTPPLSVSKGRLRDDSRRKPVCRLVERS